MAVRARDTHEVRCSVSVGCELGPSTCARTRTRADVNVRPRPFVNQPKDKTRTHTGNSNHQIAHACEQVFGLSVCKKVTSPSCCSHVSLRCGWCGSGEGGQPRGRRRQRAEGPRSLELACRRRAAGLGGAWASTFSGSLV